jgi:hypothetical protein
MMSAKSPTICHCVRVSVRGALTKRSEAKQPQGFVIACLRHAPCPSGTPEGEGNDKQLSGHHITHSQCKPATIQQIRVLTKVACKINGFTS